MYGATMRKKIKFNPLVHSALHHVGIRRSGRNPPYILNLGARQRITIIFTYRLLYPFKK